jgi:hypothetical protein
MLDSYVEHTGGFMRFWGKVTIVLALLAGLVFVVGMSAAKGAPQEAAIAGMALAMAVIPYVIFRVFAEFAHQSRLQELARMLEKRTD